MSPRPAFERGGGSLVWGARQCGWFGWFGRGGRAVGGGAAAAALLAACSGPGAVEVTAPSPPPDAEVQSMCAALLEALPDTVADDLSSRDVSPSDARAAAWGDPAVVLRCGVPKPSALVRSSACFEVNGVGWLATQDGREVTGDAPVDGTLTFTTIGRAAYVEVTVPAMDGHQPADVLPALADPIAQTIPDLHPCP